MSTRAGAAGKASCKTWRTERAWEEAGEAWKREEGMSRSRSRVTAGAEKGVRGKGGGGSATSEGLYV